MRSVEKIAFFAVILAKFKYRLVMRHEVYQVSKRFERKCFFAKFADIRKSII